MTEMRLTEIPVREVYRYLGYRGIAPSKEITERIRSCTEQLLGSVSPRQIHVYYDLEVGEKNVRAAGMEIESKGLLRNLKGCERVCLLAVTIGVEADRLVARAQLHDMLEAAIFQAAGAAAVEAWCDLVNSAIREEAAQQGYYCRPRFSPGYGDFPLEYQKNFMNLLRMPVSIGVSLTDSLLMIPSKSVTALIGLSRTEQPCILQGCEECSAAAECAYRR